jgi:hypothetical protein
MVRVMIRFAPIVLAAGALSLGLGQAVAGADE